MDANEMNALVTGKPLMEEVEDELVSELSHHIDQEIVKEIFEKKYHMDNFNLDVEIEKWGKKIPFHTDDEILDDRTYDAIARHFFELGVEYAMNKLRK